MLDSRTVIAHLPRSCAQPLLEIQGQINNVSLNNERTEKDATSKPLDQEPRATSSNDDDAQDLNPRVRYVKNEVDDNGDRHEGPGKRTRTVSSSKEDSNIAFVVKEIWNKYKKKEKTDIILKGQDLREIMYDVLGKQLEHAQNRNWLAQEQTIDDSVLKEIWYWNELSAAVKSNQGSEQGRQDLQLLLEHLADIEVEDVKLVKSISSMTKILAKDVWCLFRPGTLVISKPYQDEPQLFRVHGSSYHKRDAKGTYNVQAWAFSWTGTGLIQEYYGFTVRDLTYPKGPPGVGKTLTAETLTKCAGKPLYIVGASDVGLDPQVAERALGRFFELAERWGAVLLIDEADVFLDSRGTKGEGDLSKNALVSVMLRVLEYFKGILIMTTNRVMTFDVAMLSRCHYAVNFKSLTLQQEKDIWQGYVRQLTDQNSSGKFEIQTWVSQITKKRTKLSGREIRNLFTTAQTLAQAEPSKKVMKKHLERVYDRLMEFSEAMEKNKTTQQALLNASYT
ncbi:MAG: hypothetical protein Q9166_002840 [cf. Caloplaca sp. 2 TL-2023]